MHRPLSSLNIMRRFITGQFLLRLFLLTGLSFSIHAQDFSSPGLNLGSSSSQGFLPVREVYRPSAYFDDNTLVILWQITPEHYLYRDRTFFFSDDINLGTPTFEEGMVIDDEFYGQRMTVYRESTEMRLPATSGSGFVRVEAQGCADAGLCYPPTDFWFEVDSLSKTASHLETPPATVSTSTPGTTTPAITAEVSSLWLALFWAFLGGLILNLMPCVFPVLAIKALKISTASSSPADRAREALSYTAGILTTVLSIAGLLIVIRGAGAQVGWGFQLQSPMVVLGLSALFLLIGLSFSGQMEIGARLAGAGQDLTQRGSKPLQSFFTGVLAMVVASPCSAPFMAAAMGYAITQPTFVSLLVFAGLGLGMAAPLVALYTIPTLARLLPKPGYWMVRFRRFLAWPMYITTIWLLWVLSGQITTAGLLLAVISLIILANIIIFTRPNMQGPKKIIRSAGYALVLALFIFSTTQERPPSRDEQFTFAVLDSMVGKDQPVFLDVTADWCITCKFNERRVLHTQEIETLFAENNVVYLVADWTQENPEISALLDRYQRVGIPLYLYFPPGSQQAEVLPQILSKQMLKDLF
jgi:thiol:disulfide interchange protein DsbD